MNDAFGKKGRAAEESYFDRLERERLEKLRATMAARAAVNSPASGMPMEQISYAGTNVFKCAQSGGVWLDKESARKLLPALNSL